MSREATKIDEWSIAGQPAELRIVKGKIQIRHRGTIHNTDIPQESIPYLMHKELDIPLSECQKAYDVAIEYLRNKAKVSG